MKIRGKHRIEFHIVGDGRKFLNYWDYAHGNDVVCEIRKGKLYKSNYDENANELPETEIDFNEFLRLVEESVSKIDLP